MPNILTRRISTTTGIIVILLVAGLASWVIIKKYKEFIEIRFAPLEYHLEEKSNN